MKNKLLLFITLCMLFQGASAQIKTQKGRNLTANAGDTPKEQALLGACLLKLQVEDMSFQGNPFAFGKGEYSAAIMLTKDKFKGGKIYAIRVALGVGDEKFQVFLTKDLNKVPFYTQEVEATSQKGWNYVALDTPQDVTDGATYVGYTIVADGSKNPWGFEEGKYNAFSDWNKQGLDQWRHFSDTGIKGVNAIQAVVQGGDFSAMPQNDVTVASVANVSETIYTKPGTTATFKIAVTNYGVKPLTSLDVTYKFGEKTHTETISGLSVPCGVSTVVNVNVPFGDDDEGEHEVEILVSKLNNVEDIDPSDNKILLTIECFADTFERKILLEQYTGQTCGFCPAGEAELKKGISGMEDRVVWVAHHTYSVDAFTIDQSLQYASFFGVTGAPTAAIDRTTNELCNPGRTVFGTYRDIPRDLINASLSVPALVSVILKGEFDEQTRELGLTVSGRFVKELQNAKLNVFITENGLIARQEGNGGGEKYEHNNVMRKVLSSVFGDDLDIDADGNYSKTYTYTVPEKIGPFKCTPSNMNIIAFIADYQSGDNMASSVRNSEQILLTNIGTNINNVKPSNMTVYSQNGIVYIDGEYNEAFVYTSNGELVKKVNYESSFGLENGMYIIKLVSGENSSVKKIVVNK